jgi:uncharacterized protein (DUF1684 family)
MKLSKILVVLGVILFGLIILYSISSGPDNQEYGKVINKERAEKNNFMKNSDASPFGEVRTSFDSLKYFPANLKYKVVADLQPVENKKVLILTTSTGEEDKYLEYAWAEFELDGNKYRLLILEVMASGPTRGTLFLAFADDTSAKETYGAGRYLDLKKVPGASTIILDFNKAYNPYCAYVDNFSCPFPPQENILKVRIAAGEKTYH